MKLFFLILLLGVLTLQIACGSSSGASNLGGLAKAGNYTVVVNGQAMDSHTTHTIEIELTVQ
jgi:hypothetical protein